MTKEVYINLIEKVMTAYTSKQLRQYTDDVSKKGISEHGYPRITANLGILIAHGRKTEMTDIFIEMMDLCCREIPFGLEKNGPVAGNDFSVKEIVFCLLELEKTKTFPKSLTDKWRNDLAKIDPLKTYSVIVPTPPIRVHNWAAFGACSEQLRKYAGIGDESSFIENQIKSQILSFDENGMYRDPNEPMVYDLVTRLQLATALRFGFDDESREILEGFLLSSADITLKMQSVSGEIPYGGRSNQFLHTEAFYAALCEFYAVEFKKRGDLQKAGQFRHAAKAAVDSIIPWLDAEKKTHIKNQYDIDSKYGCEEYAYYKKYMITIASWLYLAYILADDTISDEICPSQSGGYISTTSEHFHKVFLNSGEYFAEFDTNADPHYDATGLGRIHKKGFPSALCISTPCPMHPTYTVDIPSPTPLSICGGIKYGNEYVYSCTDAVNYRLADKSVTSDKFSITFECTTQHQNVYTESCTISATGVEFTVEGDGELEILFPVFDFDGLTRTDIALSKHQVTVCYKGFLCKFTTPDTITDKNCICANRNGHYKKMAVVGKNKITLNIEMTK